MTYSEIKIQNNMTLCLEFCENFENEKDMASQSLQLFLANLTVDGQLTQYI